ncbi:MAG: subclass B1 metallo-beta-lactamase [Allomuricauda sp.]
MNPGIPLLILLLTGFLPCKAQKNTTIYESPTIEIEKLTRNTYRHISYLSTDDFGKVGCNGMIVVDGKEALIFDTPTNDRDSRELVDWVEISLGCKVIGVIVTHFHDDCLGGLNEFHERQIPSYASFRTIELAKANGEVVPQNGFDNYLELPVGNKKVVNAFFGEGHTIDNIVSYFPYEKVLFGGCLIKTLGASKGYLGDANVNDWSKTVLAVKSQYGKAKVIIPGHGKPGNSEVLDYTIELFKIAQ